MHRRRPYLLRDAEGLADRIHAFVGEARDLHVRAHFDGLRRQAPPDVCDERRLDLQRNPTVRSAIAALRKVEAVAVPGS